MTKGSDMKDVRLEIKVRNNLILRRMEELGIKTPAELARRSGVDAGRVGDLINMKRSPLKSGSDPLVPKWLSIVEKIAIILECSPEDLFSETQRAIEYLKTERSFFLEVDIEQLRRAEIGGAMSESALLVDGLDVVERVDRSRVIRNILTTLTPREEKVIRMLYGLDDGKEYSLSEVGLCLSISSERVRQIEAMALRKLRRPSRIRRLR
jgi:DNA-binding CsgD family transcriptional regulator